MSEHTVDHVKEIRKFAGSDAEVFLHGSRSKLNVVDPDTDWDYAVNYLPQSVIKTAMNLCWTPCVDESYLDSNTSVVLEKGINGEKVQVSARYDLGAFKRVWEAITPKYYKENLWKKKTAMRDYLESNYYTVTTALISTDFKNDFEMNWGSEVPF